MHTSVRHFSPGTFGRHAAIMLLCATAIVPLAASNQWRWKEKHRSRDAVWVVNRDAGKVMVFDADNGEPMVEEPINIGPGVHDIVFSPKTGTVFISDDASKVYVVSIETRHVIDTIQFAASSRPHHLSISHNGKTVYVGLFASNTIAAIDTRTHEVRVLASSLLGGVTAHAPEPSPNDRFIYVPHEGQNLVSKLSARTGMVRAEANPGPLPTSSPSEVLATRDGETLFVSMRNEGTIRTIDLDTFQPTGDVVSVGVQPESLILSPGERTLMVSLRGMPARLAFVDTDPLELEKTLDVGPTGSNGDLATESPDGRYVYMTFDLAAAGIGGVAKVDVHKRVVVDTFPYPGTGRPHGIAYVAGKGRRH